MKFRSKHNFFIDCGTHLGQSIQAFKSTKKYREGNWKIFAFEAHKELIPHVDMNGTNLMNAAVWIKEGPIRFYPTQIYKSYLKDSDEKQPGPGSSLIGLKETGDLNRSNPQIIQGIDFSKWLDKTVHYLDYTIVNMDIEGAEIEVLEKLLLDRTINLIDELYVEFHAEKIGLSRELERKLIDRIEAAGVAVFETRKQKEVENVV